MSEQKEKALKLRKEQLILSYKEAISSNIKSYNETLKVCDCNHVILKEGNDIKDLS